MTIQRRGTRHHFRCVDEAEMLYVLKLDARKWGAE